ncbi:universal stress protein [Streptomyces coeruleoprunus]|uniref:Universal stress protein n=1 Tax=Streptomyces coeruleoprunus TaxID=285563 RepID=A0ABV9XC03_9ACTN
MNHEPTTGPDPHRGAVVAGVDGSPEARAAVLWAAAEAGRRGLPLRIVHASGTDTRTPYASVETLERIRHEGHDLLVRTADLVAERFPDLPVTRTLSHRQPAAALLDAAGDDGTIVVGNRGHGGFTALMLGSVGLDVASRAKAPVIVVRGDLERPRTGTVVAAVKGEEDHHWVRHAARAARWREATLRLITVWSPVSQVGEAVTMLDNVDEIAHERVHELHELADRLREEFPGLTVTIEVVSGHSTAGRLVEATEQADLVVVSTHRKPLGLGRTLGRVTHALLHHAHCPVEVVPRPKHEGDPLDRDAADEEV